MNTFAIISYDHAKEAGLKHYYTGKPCKRGHLSQRLVRNSECLECKKHGKRVYGTRNPHTVAIRNLRRDRPHSLIPLSLREMEQLHEIYLHRNALTESTGDLHHVDHAWPLARGGIHHPLNLQVLIAESNVEKGAEVDLSDPVVLRGLYCSLFGHERAKIK